MKKLFIFVVLFIATIFGMATSDCVAEEKSMESKITIVLEDGSLYKMTEGDEAQWKFFVSSNREIKIIEALVVFSAMKNEVRAVADVKIVEGGRQSDILGYTGYGNLPIIKNVIASVQDAIIHRN